MGVQVKNILLTKRLWLSGTISFSLIYFVVRFISCFSSLNMTGPKWLYSTSDSYNKTSKMGKDGKSGKALKARLAFHNLPLLYASNRTQPQSLEDKRHIFRMGALVWLPAASTLLNHATGTPIPPHFCTCCFQLPSIGSPK